MSGEENLRPFSEFAFNVKIGNSEILFHEVFGLQTEAPNIEYRHGRDFTTIKMPGLRNTGKVVFKHGYLTKDDGFWEWFDKIETNIIERRVVVIELVGVTGITSMTWTLKNACPINIIGRDMKSDTNATTVEIIELVHEGITSTII